MAGVHRRRRPTAVAGGRQGTLLHRFGRQADGGVHYRNRIDAPGRGAGRPLSHTAPQQQYRQTAIRDLPRRPIPAQPAIGIVRRRADHLNPELEAEGGEMRVSIYLTNPRGHWTALAPPFEGHQYTWLI